MTHFTKSFYAYLLFCCCGISSLAQTTVIVNPGGSIQSALNAATPGTTIRVTAGTYTQKVLFSSKSGTSGNYIILKADPGVILSGTGLSPSGREGLITIINSSYVRVEGFDIQNFITGSGQTPCGILMEGSGAKVQIVNNKIHNIRNNATCEDCPEGAHGLAVFGTSSTGITDLLVQGNEIYSNILESSEALVLNGNVDRFEVLNNNVHDNNNIGYDFIGYEGECAGCGDNDRVRNGIVRGNIATNNTSITNPAYGGVGSAGGFYVDGGRFIVFEGNTSTGNDLGFEFASEHPNKATEDILVMNNFIYNNREVGITLGGYESGLGESRRIQIYNNSFYKNKGWGTEVIFQFKVINSRFANNIFFGEGTAAESYEETGAGNTGNVWGTNIWWGTSTASTGLPGTKVLQNPLYVSPTSGNLNIQSGSPAINAGALSPDITTWTSSIWDTYFPPSGNIPVHGLTDINGQPRIENATIDLGADEFGSGTATIPGVPSNVVATANASTQITVTWTDNSTNETGFIIERSLTSGSGFAQIATVGSNVATYQNTGLTASTTYYYRVAANNTAGTSAFSNVANATTSGAATIPTVPSALAATANSSSQITITWADNSNNETGFIIQRSLTSGSGYTQIGTTGSNVTSYQSTGLSPSTAYYYRVAANNTAGTSAFSNVANASTQSGGGTTITVDGNTTDWASIGAISTTGAGGLTSLKVYSDATNLYILAQGTINTNYSVFINKDNVSTTGFTAGLWSPEGSDYNLENGTLYKYNGTGTNWSWTTTGVTQTGIASVKNASAIEIKIPKATIVDLGAVIKLGVDVENSGWTTVATIPAQGGAMATYSAPGGRLRSETSEEVISTGHLYPNPSKGIVHLSYFVGETDRDMIVSLYSQTGAKVREFNIDAPREETQETTLQLNDLTDGLYFVRVNVGSRITTYRLLVQR